MSKWKQYRQLISNMGWRYISFRFLFELKRKSGILKKRFPIKPEQKSFLTLLEWKTSSFPFFFRSREDLNFDHDPDFKLKEQYDKIVGGEFQFFSSQYFVLGNNYDWITNPDTNFRYDINKHWTEIDDYDKDSGDIKYVWEKSRFSFLYTIIRYDYHFGKDNSPFIFGQIENWIDSNPINQGPNYKCSQEISLRILNWIFALYFYKNSQYLTDKLFQKIIHSIYWQLHHVYHNINFSRIAVRNNHAITETLALYIVSSLFPQFPDADKWRRKGKEWFEKEVDYQIYDDGTYLQFSMNYHRVVIQLLTWAIRIADLNKDTFKQSVYDKAYKSLNFLYQCQEDTNGFLPNYGSNDGALFFKLSDNNYRDYRPQLDALHILLTGNPLYNKSFEDIYWYGNNTSKKYPSLKKKYGIISFPLGGYYLIRESDTLTFIRCGSHKDRPAQADNLHVDIWHKGENIFPDGGTYKYNTDDNALKYFMGTASHNTVMLDDFDQMQKGARFIWYNWTQALSVNSDENEEFYVFSGSVSCFTYLKKNITHHRKVIKLKGKPEWHIEDVVENKPDNIKIRQLWHTNYGDKLVIESVEEEIQPVISIGSFSEYYGQKTDCSQKEFNTFSDRIKTIIRIN